MLAHFSQSSDIFCDSLFFLLSEIDLVEISTIKVKENVVSVVIINLARYRVSHKSDFTLFLLISRVLEHVQRNF